MQKTGSRKNKKVDIVFAELERRILDKVWKINDQIPTEAELSEEFHCSRSTIGKAVAKLEHGRLVSRRTRAGTHVISNVSTQVSSPFLLNACAFIYPSEHHEGVWRTMRGFQNAASNLDQRALLLSTRADIQQEVDIVSRLGEFDVRGAVIFPMVIDPLNHPYYSRMVTQSKFPIVFVEVNLPETRRPAVIVDGFDAGYVATRHLLGLGLRKVGFLANYAWTTVARDKYQGYRRAMTEAGIQECSQHAMLEPEMHPNYDDPFQEPTEIAKHYLSEHPDVEGVVCTSDFLAVGVLRAAKERGIRVPEELKVVGMDDFAFAAEHGLTTYQIPYEEIGDRSFRVLNAILSGNTAPDEIHITGTLVRRKTA